MRIGVFGGTFDPVHTGHLIVAEMAAAELDLDRVLFVLAPNPPHKESHEISPVAHRLAMLKMALEGNSRFSLSTVELNRAGASYSIDTLNLLRNASGAIDEYYFIFGMDSLTEFHKWRNPEAIMKAAQLVVFPRVNFSLEQVDNRFRQAGRFLPGPMVEISSTEIRRRQRERHSIRYLVPESVRRYIDANRLYL